MDSVIQPKEEADTNFTNSMAPLSKLQLEQLISENSSQITFIRKDGNSDSESNVRSSVWGKYTVVCVETKPQEFVRCDDCGTLIGHKRGNTSRLTRHTSSCRTGNAFKSSGQQLTLDDFHKRPVPNSARKAINEALTIGLAKDLKPLGMAKGKGFLHIAQQLVNFGAKYQFQDIRKILHHPTTLKRSLPAIVQREVEDITNSLMMAPSYPKFAFTTDMWTDGFQQRHFLSLCIHYLDKSFKLNSYLLAVNEFPDVDKTTENIRSECEAILKKYFNENYSAVMNSSTAVTDGGSNFISVFPNRLPCMCHRLNLLIHWTFNDKQPREGATTILAEKKKFVLSEACPSMRNTVAAVKNLVRYFKKAGLNVRLTDTLKQENDTRWNSKLRMLQSYQKSSGDVKAILLEKNEVGKLMNISDSAVDELIDFLLPFKQCTDAWSMDKEPTIHLVVYWIQKLRSHIELQPTDSAEVQKLKKQALICLEEYLKVEDIYYAAYMLDPGKRKLKTACADDEARRRVIKLLRQKIDDITTPPTITLNDSDYSEPSASVSKRGKYDDLDDSSDDDTNSEKHEMDQYLELKFQKDEHFDILVFWKNASNLPKLRKVALEILAIPASQTTDERVFSSTGTTLSPRRTELKGSTLSDLTFIHKNVSI